MGQSKVSWIHFKKIIIVKGLGYRWIKVPCSWHTIFLSNEQVIFDTPDNYINLLEYSYFPLYLEIWAGHSTTKFILSSKVMFACNYIQKYRDFGKDQNSAGWDAEKENKTSYFQIRKRKRKLLLCSPLKRPVDQINISDYANVLFQVRPANSYTGRGIKHYGVKTVIKPGKKAKIRSKMFFY